MLDTITTNIRVFDVILPPHFFTCDIPMLNLKMRDSFHVSIGGMIGCKALPSAEKEIAAKLNAPVGVRAGVYEDASFGVNSGIGVQLNVDGFYNQTSIDSLKSGVGVGSATEGTLTRLRMLSDLGDMVLSDIGDQTLREFYYIEI